MDHTPHVDLLLTDRAPPILSLVQDGLVVHIIHCVIIILAVILTRLAGVILAFIHKVLIIVKMVGGAGFIEI